ncbi:MAG: hypothetical protein JWR00_990 [Rubritepida sp.]|nr:hypothetical protein [Rubritepida sp.]
MQPTGVDPTRSANWQGKPLPALSNSGTESLPGELQLHALGQRRPPSARRRTSQRRTLAMIGGAVRIPVGSAHLAPAQYLELVALRAGHPVTPTVGGLVRALDARQTCDGERASTHATGAGHRRSTSEQQSTHSTRAAAPHGAILHQLERATGPLASSSWLRSARSLRATGTAAAQSRAMGQKAWPPQCA